ncbi:hypothetical protein CBR_g54048 [Chara braunii]|uniref:CCHC-type domain-containing protein n=1 Tax=Chara braunii TaxID=69332 RepID=A0A388MBV7_CHABU|nr:hypothetical protein CBR_g54048 [Chara braunii]|eukprot:GBG91952.1 hypothetical protein CBR_g54048 [Chara braunii]
MQAGMAGGGMASMMGQGSGAPAMGGLGMGTGVVGAGLNGQNGAPQNLTPQNIMPAAPYGVVTCHICGKLGHYARNCWQAGNRQRPEEENVEMRELLLRIARREKEEDERKGHESDEAKRKEEDERRESEKLREEQAREAKLEATVLRILAQRKAPLAIVPAQQLTNDSKKRSPRSKAQMLMEIRSYTAESEDDSEEVREEAKKLVEAFENRKKSKKGGRSTRATTSRTEKKYLTPRKEKGLVKDPTPLGNDFETPTKVCPAEGSSEGLIDYVLTQTKVLSALRAGEIRKICDKEGVEYIRKDISIQEIVKCRTRLAYEGFFELKNLGSTPKTQGGGLDVP